MIYPAELLRRLRHFVQRDRVTRDLEEEMRIHVEMRAESLRRLRPANADLLHDGDDAPSHANAYALHEKDDAPRPANDAAFVAARKRFGNATSIQQRSQDMWGFAWLDELAHDVRFAIRRLAQRPAFTAAVVGVMTIGIGATTAMFSAVDAALFRPLPFIKPEQLVVLPVSVPFDDPSESADATRGRSFNIGDAAAMTNVFQDVGAYAAGALDLADPEHPLHLNTGVVSSNFMGLLGIQPFKGRSFAPGEGNAGSAKVALLSYALWQREYGGRDIAGMHLLLGVENYEVVGVMPPDFSFPRQSDIWIPMSIPSTLASLRPFGNSFNETVVARLNDGVTVEAASAQMMARWQQIHSANQNSGETTDYLGQHMREHGGATSLQRELVGDTKSALLVLLGTTVLLLLVACVNVTNLLLAHGAARAREIAVRQVLGATRVRVIRQLLTESVVLSLGGAALGTLLAPLALNFLTLLLPKSLAGVATAHIDLRVLSFAIVLAVTAGVAAGMWPAVGSVQKDSSDALKGGGGYGSTAARGGTVRRSLIGVELAVTTALLIGAGLLLKSFREVMSRETGMQTAHVGTMQLTLPRTAGAAVARAQRIDDILQRFATMPDIKAAGFVNDLPLGRTGAISLRLNIEGAAPVASQNPEVAMTRWLQASGGYFPAMGIKLLRGRLFTPADGPAAPRVAVIGERMAKTYWPDVDPIGRTFRLPMDSTPTTVVGIVADVREDKLERDPMMQLYLSVYAMPPSAGAIVVRSAVPERELLARMMAVVRAVDPSQAVYNVRMMDDVVGMSVAPRRTNTTLITVFALLALGLASIGVYAVVAYGVSHRARELGIRLALGATGANLMRMISGELAWVIALGIAAGVAGAWAAARTLESLVFGISVHDPFTYVAVPLVLTIPVILATVLPARRVLRVNPSDVLRGD